MLSELVHYCTAIYSGLSEDNDSTFLRTRHRKAGVSRCNENTKNNREPLKVELMSDPGSLSEMSRNRN